MFEVKDTYKLGVKKVPKLKKFTSGNMLFFRTRCRSRSFHYEPDLVKSASSDELNIPHDDELWFGTKSKNFDYTPGDSSNSSNYVEVEKLFEIPLSPTIVTLIRRVSDDKVGCSPISSIFKAAQLLKDVLNESLKLLYPYD